MTDKPKKRPQDLRSQQWFGRQDRDGFAYRSWVKGKGVPHDQFDGRPVIGICNTFSELTPCNSHFRTLAEQVKIGVYEAGGFPLEFPVMSLGETLLRPTAMLYRNLASMDVEESIRANPIDGVVMLAGCDKTVPAMLMGAASAGGPAIMVVTGPMITGSYRGERLGACTDCRRFWGRYRAGEIDKARESLGAPELAFAAEALGGTVAAVAGTDDAQRKTERRRPDARLSITADGTGRRADPGRKPRSAGGAGGPLGQPAHRDRHRLRHGHSGVRWGDDNIPAALQEQPALDRLLSPATVILRADAPSRALEGLDCYVETAKGKGHRIAVEENGVRYIADLTEGQKTGWYYDQRDNRRFTAGLSKDARVLDVYSYSGGFGVLAAKEGAREVTCIDRSATALDAARQAAGLDDRAYPSADPVSSTPEISHALLTLGLLDAIAFDAEAERIGVPAVFIEHRTPPDTIACLKSGACDLVFLPRDGRATAIGEFSNPFIISEFTMLVPPGSAIETIADADRPGVRIAAVRGHASAAALAGGIKHAAIVVGDNEEAAFALLRSRLTSVDTAAR